MTRIVEVDDRVFVGAANPSNWWLLQDGLVGWDDSPDTRYDSDPIPGQDGNFMPPNVYVDGREVEFVGAHRAASQEAAEAEVRLWAAGLAKRTDLVLKVTDTSGTKTSRVWTRGRVRVKTLDELTTQFMIVFYAPDPRKYGPEQTYLLTADSASVGGLLWPAPNANGVFDFGPFSAPPGITGGKFDFYNPGSIESWPIYTARGGITGGFIVASEGLQLKFQADVPDGSELVLSPYAGGRAVLDGVDVTRYLTSAEWVPVGARERRAFTFTPLSTVSAQAEFEATFREAWL